ncbi:kynurenine 3-monooxygenase [Tilletiaria anomala UBC 951]|uniref:Kynurenine 3-monooxygenase n=1 Tax=Tilletiaria anomala (strain ATCC 24038 / CBS 436.72 / UBC 951) TaxID=1037660 RepID=A0A066W439_TILAU|nr:kynurenine 3-monooxygenase [Tilletiaria anomala UBC 951]KDN48491.1 kynurenine 3-monooxygenase [Tilletiaria anomala UBC 951]
MPLQVIVVGAGPVGCLAALGLAQRGCHVQVFDSRRDPRPPSATANNASTSINLAISTRGLTGLRSVRPWQHDLADIILSEAVPMCARMIHTLPTSLGASSSIKLLSQAYSTVGECINSVDRARLNNLLLDQAARHPLIDVFFEYKLLRADLEHALPQDEQVLKQCDVVIGCDGHHSKLRGEMVRFVPRMDFSQSYIDNGYVELSIPRRSDHPDAGVREHVPRYSRAGATKRMPDDDEFLLDPNHLHIWPRHDFMLIALPNRDGSFTCTLFAPFNQIDRADVQPRTMIDFFQRHFPDALPLISPAALVRDLSSRKPSNLGMVSINPYTYKDRAILLGDSAHAMVPFYGQGLNCGLEDVRVMLQYIDQMLPQEEDAVVAPTTAADMHAIRHALRTAFNAYSSHRRSDLVAISSLAIQNYNEMSSRVVSSAYIARMQLDGLLMRTLPKGWWRSLYSMVTFSNERYSAVVQRRDWQNDVVKTAVEVAAGLAAVGLSAGAWAAGRWLLKGSRPG